MRDMNGTLHQLLQAEQQRNAAVASTTRTPTAPSLDAALSKLAILSTQTQSLYEDLFTKSTPSSLISQHRCVSSPPPPLTSALLFACVPTVWRTAERGR